MVKVSSDDFFSPERLKEIRKALKMSGEIFGESLGITKGYVSQMERGARIPKAGFVKLLFSVFSVNKSWWESGEGPMFVTQIQTGPVEIAEAAAAYALTVDFDKRPLEDWEIANLALLRDLKEGDPEMFSRAVQEIAMLHYAMMKLK